MPKPLILFPFGGNAREALITIQAGNRLKPEWDVLGFIDDSPKLRGKNCCSVKVLGGKEVLTKFPKAQVLAVPGNPDNYLKRLEIIAGLKVAKTRWATIIHPSVVVSADAKIGYNTLLMSNVVVSCAVQIGNHCVILPNTVISHDSRVGDYCCLGSNVSVSGQVQIGRNCYIGSGSKFRQKITIGPNSLVGLGSNVVANVLAGEVVAGNPARPMRKVER